MDQIVSAVSHEGSVYIFMRSGKVYKMYRDGITGHMTFALQVDLAPH
jgi:hypothetical protein